MHGSLEHENNKLDGSFLLPRISKAFSNKYYSLNCKGIQSDPHQVERLFEDQSVARIFEQFSNLTISISGVGMFYPEPTSVLIRGGYLSKDEIDGLKKAGAYGDLLFRFFDKDGNECSTNLRSRTIAIPWVTYKKIHNKIIVATDERKYLTIHALLKGKLVDTLIIDQPLAKSLCSLIEDN